jgi:hypothetical protein
MVTPEEAARLAGVSWREMARRLEAGEVHFTETQDGRMQVCPRSISERD